MILNNSIHIFLQPQSNIGKGYISLLLKQYLSEKNDIGYFLIKKKNIALWDDLFNEIVKQKKTVFIISVSSICFVEFSKYLRETKIFNSIKALEIDVFNHYIFTPGRNGEGVQEIFNFIASTIKKRSGKNIIWENNNLGTTLKNYTKGQCSMLKDFPGFKEIKNDIFTTIYLPAETLCFQKDLSFHIRSGKTFNQAIYHSPNNLIFRQRLYQIKKRTFKAMENGSI